MNALFDVKSVSKAAIIFMLAVIVGWAFSVSFHSGEESKSTVDIVNKRSEGQSKRRVRGGRLIDIVRSPSSPDERMRATVSLAMSIPEKDIQQWLSSERFRPGDGYEKTLFTRILKDRQELADPESFREPTPAEVLEAFIEEAAGGLPEGERDYPFKMIAEKDPAALEAALDRLLIPYRDYAEEALIARGLAESFDEEIRKLWQRPDGWHVFKSHLGNAEVLEKLFRNPREIPEFWRNSLVKASYDRVINSEVAEFWWNMDTAGTGFTSEERIKIKQESLTAIARTDGRKALGLIDEAGFDLDQREDLIGWVFSRGGLTEPEEKSLLDLLVSEKDVQIAEEAIKRRRSVR